MAARIGGITVVTGQRWAGLTLEGLRSEFDAVFLGVDWAA